MEKVIVYNATKPNLTQEDIIKARNDFIRTFLDKGAKYIRRINKDELPDDGLKFCESRKKGTEILIEYHEFEMNDVPLIGQWRLV